MRKVSKISLSLIAGAATAVVIAGPAAAGANPTPKTTGSVTASVSGYPHQQFLSYDAFQTTPAKGNVSYSNFDYPAAGSGVWVPDLFNMGFAVGTDPTTQATYTQNVTSWNPTGQTSVAFTGTGSCGCGWNSTFSGTLGDGAFTLAMTEINASNPSETYVLTATGSVASAGSVAGTWSDNYAGGRTGSFTIASVGHEILHYVAPVAHASVSGKDAYFDYVIPAGVPGLGGLAVFFHVQDGGSSGAGNDTVEFGTTNSMGPFPNKMTVTGGNLTVFS